MGVNQRDRVVMSEAEIADFIVRGRTATLATIGPGGHPHLVAMWYAVVDGQIWFETKTKSQKAVNLRRDDRISVLIEDGERYEELRGVSIEGRGVLVDDPDATFRVGVNVWERYMGPYTEELRPAVETMMRNRIVLRVDTRRTRSWDHRKLASDA